MVVSSLPLSLPHLAAAGFFGGVLWFSAFFLFVIFCFFSFFLFFFFPMP